MVPLTYHDQQFVCLDNSQQQNTNSSLAYQYTSDALSQFNSQPVTKEQSQNAVTVPSSSFSKKAQSFSTLPSPNSKMTHSRAMKSPSLYSKSPATPSKDAYLKSSFNSSWKSFDSTLSHHKPQTTSVSRFTNTSSLEPSPISLRSKLPLPKTQTSSNIDLCWKSPLLESTQRVSASSSSSLHHQETPSLNVIWTSPSLELSQSEHNSTVRKSKSQKDSSLDYLWSSLLESNQKALTSPPLNHKPQRNDSPTTSSSLEVNRTAQNSPSPDCKPLKIPVSNSNNNVLNLPLSQVKSRKSPLLSHPVHPSHSLPVCPPKPKIVLRCDSSTRSLSSPVSHTRVHSTTSPNDKYKARQVSSVHPKPNISGQRLSSPKPSIKNKNALIPSSKFQSKGSCEQIVKPEPENEIPWSLDYSHPCIIKGGTVPADVVNKIVNSISKSTIQKDLSRQILFRRMRGRPNPHPGPRLSSMYTVCLDCASCIKSQCNHLTGKKDPRCATLFVIPTPESSSDGKIDVKIVLILSLPETSSSSCYQLPMKDNQPDDNLEALDENLEELEKITQLFPASESDFIQGLKTNKKWLAVSSEDKDDGNSADF
ncbi:casein kinase II subunit alpha'-interacting protein isoform X2 [Mesocricetus auratus]|uniref:Casein kinase II subunit alpha'-interacting protein isoform X2 n=1 Tax=Mesocricetus auratus TaxID=10036 RepID=A0ABM2XVF7_MESAU|nr:casein kinase II subunit alpha'-interacting protein isoform X2 [Mesocricetus auratus]